MNLITVSSVESVSPLCASELRPVHGTFVSGIGSEAAAILSLFNREVLLVTEYRHQIQTGALPALYRTGLAALAVVPGTRLLAAAGFVSGKAAEHVYKRVAWHHYILIEALSATFKIELLREGVRVQGIVASARFQSAGATQHRRAQLTRNVPGQKHPEAGVRVKFLNLEAASVTLRPLQEWVAEHGQENYNLLTFNCQHFSDVVMALYESCSIYS